MNLPKLTPEESEQFKNGVMQVNGKAMNRTALGIIDAFLQLYPKATFADLKAAFPDSLNPQAPRQAPKSIFRPYSDRDFGVVHSLKEIQTEFEKNGLPYQGFFFLEENEKFTTADGVTVIVNKLWESNDDISGRSDLELLTEQAVKYGIVVNKFEPRTSFSKGSYSIDIIHPDLKDKLSGKVQHIDKEVVIEKTVEKKVIPFWVWIILVLAIIALILWLLGYCNPKPKIVEKVVTQEKIVTKVDTVYLKEIEELEKKFNAVQFQVGKYDIPEDAKYALYDLSKIMIKNKELKLKVEGHTSKEGNLAFNKLLSEKRAKTVVDFLISKGVDSTRLTFEGLGSAKPIDENDLEKNRRTEFVTEEVKQN
jgi:outer membrane protein OmpA-like peptidoglycan-associated protein